MTDNKFTDAEIIKALECCTKRTVFRNCEQRRCPAIKECGKGLMFVEKQALDLINRQKAELDDLKRDDLPRCKDALRRANEIGMAVDKENQDLKAEIERLGCDLSVARGLLSRVDSSLVATRNIARAEAIKEFADKIKDKFDKHGVEYTAYVIVDDVSKEIVGEDNNSPIVDNQN